MKDTYPLEVAEGLSVTQKESDRARYTLRLQGEGLVRTWKGNKRVRGAHPVRTAEGRASRQAQGRR